jgi:hypothetical protein
MNNLFDTTKEMWLESLEHAKNIFSKDENPKTIFFDEDIVNASSGFMAGPLSLFEGKAIAATIYSYASLEELKSWVREESSKSKMIVYMTFEMGGKYFWRGAIIKDNE